MDHSPPETAANHSFRKGIKGLIVAFLVVVVVAAAAGYLFYNRPEIKWQRYRNGAAALSLMLPATPTPTRREILGHKLTGVTANCGPEFVEVLWLPFENLHRADKLRRRRLDAICSANKAHFFERPLLADEEDNRGERPTTKTQCTAFLNA